jgi:methyl-accepting chemotaxis protein
MDEMTQQNAALVEESAAASKSINGEFAQSLLEQVDFFNEEEKEVEIVSKK